MEEAVEKIVTDSKSEIELDNELKQIYKKNNVMKLHINPHGSGEKYLVFLYKKSDMELSFTAKLKGDLHPIKCWYDGDDNMCIMPYNGPLLQERQTVPHNPDYLIKKIHYSQELETYILDLELLKYKLDLDVTECSL